MANQHINECIIAATKKKTKKKTLAHKSIILIGITSPQLAEAPAGLGSSSDKWKAAVWIQRRPVISQNTRTTTAFCLYWPCNQTEGVGEWREMYMSWEGGGWWNDEGSALLKNRLHQKIPFSHQCVTLNRVDRRGKMLQERKVYSWRT